MTTTFIVLGVLLWLYCGYGAARAAWIFFEENFNSADGMIAFSIFSIVFGAASLGGAFATAGWAITIEGLTFYRPKKRNLNVSRDWVKRNIFLVKKKGCDC